MTRPAFSALDSRPSTLDYTASDGDRLRFRRWVPAGPRVRGFVVALHGIQSHSGWYGYSSGRLAEAGWRVDFLDRRGSGMNDAGRGHAGHAERLLNDVVQFLAGIRHERDRVDPDLPVVLLAVSWGGKLAASVAARRPELLDALAILYPGLCPRLGPTWYQSLGLHLARRLGGERRRVRVPLDDPALFTSQPEWQEFIRDDPLALREVTVGFLNASRDLDRIVAGAPERIDCPVLMMLAGRDEIIDNEGTRRWFARVAAADKRLLEYGDARHTLEFEPNRAAIVDDLLAWLDGISRRGCG
ncbi:MAG TPA: alpha/beta fold hydrolase [Planctomycetaceae bacterium]|nr:alpha/beta fold hydrolase [Planctomycetaceae bacterium]